MGVKRGALRSRIAVFVLVVIGCGCLHRGASSARATPREPRPTTLEARLLGTSGPFQSFVRTQRTLPTIEVWRGFRRDVGHHVIRLRVGNLRRADESIQEFGIANVPKPFATWSPPQWLGWYRYAGADSGFAWSCIDTLTPKPPGWEAALWPSPYSIAPGDSVHTFYFYTAAALTRFSCYAAGFDTMPAVGHDRSPLWQSSLVAEVFMPVTEGGEGTGRPSGIGSRTPASPASGTSICFELPATATTHLRIEDAQGHLVAEPVSGVREAGIHAAVWQGADESGAPCRPGPYWARLQVNGKLVGSERIRILR